jgi:hypothetical protein
VRDDLGERAVVRAVRAHRMGALGVVRCPEALGQHRVGKALDLLLRHTCCRGHLLHGRSGADPGLDLSWSQLALQLDRDLAEPGQVAPRGSAQPFVGRHRVALEPNRVLEDDLTVLGEPDDPQRPHGSPSPRSSSPCG